MYKLDKPDHLKRLREKVSEISTRGDDTGSPEGHDINPLARQIAEQFKESSFTPAMIVGFLRLAEFAGLSICGLLIHYFYGSGGAFPFLGYLLTITAGSALAVLRRRWGKAGSHLGGKRPHSGQGERASRRLVWRAPQ